MSKKAKAKKAPVRRLPPPIVARFPKRRPVANEVKAPPAPAPESARAKTLKRATAKPAPAPVGSLVERLKTSIEQNEQRERTSPARVVARVPAPAVATPRKKAAAAAAPVVEAKAAPKKRATRKPRVEKHPAPEEQIIPTGVFVQPIDFETEAGEKVNITLELCPLTGKKFLSTWTPRKPFQMTSLDLARLDKIIKGVTDKWINHELTDEPAPAPTPAPIASEPRRKRAASK